jgi:hypothetical protein
MNVKRARIAAIGFMALALTGCARLWHYSNRK